MDFDEQIEIKKQFGKFLIGYILEGHTASLEALEEINNLTDEYLNTMVPANLYFDEDMVRDYIDYLNENMTDENKDYPHLCFKKSPYIQLLIDYIKHYIKKIVKMKP